MPAPPRSLFSIWPVLRSNITLSLPFYKGCGRPISSLICATVVRAAHPLLFINSIHDMSTAVAYANHILLFSVWFFDLYHFQCQIVRTEWMKRLAWENFHQKKPRYRPMVIAYWLYTLINSEHGLARIIWRWMNIAGILCQWLHI